MNMVVLLALCICAPGEEAERIFREANQAYHEQRYEDAIEGYRQLTERHGVNTPEIFHNLGNAWLKSGKPGNAILYYEAALALDPDYEPTLVNRDKALAATRRTLPLPDPRKLNGNVFLRHSPLSPKHSLYLAHGALFAAIALLLLREWRPGARIQWAGYVALSLGLALFALTALTNRALRDAPKLAVACESEAPVYFSMNESDAPRFLLYEGDRVFIDRMEGDWIRVNAYGGERGWTRKDALGIVEYRIW